MERKTLFKTFGIINIIMSVLLIFLYAIEDAPVDILTSATGLFTVILYSGSGVLLLEAE